jgi:hypothetical protein
VLADLALDGTVGKLFDEICFLTHVNSPRSGIPASRRALAVCT